MNSDFKKKPNIIIVDDHLIFRQGLKAIINYENLGTIIGEASNGKELLEQLTRLKPDLVLMDIDMPEMNGFEATQKALEIMPELKIIAFTVFPEEEYSVKMMHLGAKGFILKSSGFNELDNVIQIVMKGESSFSGKLSGININGTQPKVRIETSETTINALKRKGEMLFFPWVVNRKDYAHSPYPK